MFQEVEEESDTSLQVVCWRCWMPAMPHTACIAWYLKLLHDIARYCMVFEAIAWYCVELCGRLLAVFNACKATHGGHWEGAPSHPPGGYGALLRWVYSHTHCAPSQNTVLPMPRWFCSTSWLEVPSGYYLVRFPNSLGLVSTQEGRGTWLGTTQWVLPTTQWPTQWASWMHYGPLQHAAVSLLACHVSLWVVHSY